MATFPSTILPRQETIPRVPTGLRSVGGSGGVQLLGSQQIGRMWEATWADLRLGRADVEALLTWVEWAFHTSQIFDVTHSALPGSGKAPLGAGGGTPLVAGASQTGESLNTDGWSASVTNVVRAGDVLKIAGLTPLFRVVEDASSNGLGAATIKINPPIPAGSSPADNAAITRTGCVIRAMVWDYNAPAGRPGQFISGLRVTFREVP